MKKLISIAMLALFVVACADRPEDGTQGDDDTTPPVVRPDAGGTDRPDADYTQPPTTYPDAGYTTQPDAGTIVGAGTVNCTESGGTTTINVSGGILAHLVNLPAISPDSNWSLRCGYGCNGAVNWTSDGASYALTSTNAFGGFNLLLQNTSGTQYWFDVLKFNTSGTCSHGTNEFSHSASATPTGSKGSIVCSEAGNYVNVTISGDILAHLGTPANPDLSWKIEYGSNVDVVASGDGWAIPYFTSAKDSEYWSDSNNGDSNYVSYVLQLPNTATSFNFAVTNGSNATSWFQLDGFTVSGSSCSHVAGGGSITRSSTGSNPSGTATISCGESGANTNVTISGGILAHLFTDGLSPNSSWVIRHDAGTTEAGWVSDSTSYTLSLPNTANNFNFRLRNPSSGGEYWFDLNEFAFTGTCSHAFNAGGIAHNASGSQPSGTIVGNIQCQQANDPSTGVLKRKVVISSVSNFEIRDGLNDSPSYLPSPTSIQYGGSDGWQLPYPSGVNKPSLLWVNGFQVYTFYLDLGVTDFNFFVVDGDDPSDSWANGDFFNLDKWSISNVGSGNCHRVGNGISIN